MLTIFAQQSIFSASFLLCNYFYLCFIIVSQLNEKDKIIPLQKADNIKKTQLYLRNRKKISELTGKKQNNEKVEICIKVLDAVCINYSDYKHCEINLN